MLPFSLLAIIYLTLPNLIFYFFDVIMVASILAIIFSPVVSVTVASVITRVLPDLITSPVAMILFELAGRIRFTFNSTVKTSASSGIVVNAA
jgi:hypothetical protein